MIELGKRVGGDSGFVPVVERALNNAVEFSRPSDVYVVQVDGWFDYKWQQFSGTILHEISVWRHELTVPPFHPSRVLSETYFRLHPESETYEVASAKPLHIFQAGAEKLNRAVKDFSSSGVFSDSSSTRPRRNAS